MFCLISEFASSRVKLPASLGASCFICRGRTQQACYVRMSVIKR